MSAPSDLTDVALPDWVGTPLTATGSPETPISDRTAVGSDIAGAIEQFAGLDDPLMNPLGGVATGYVQYQNSIAQLRAIRLLESAVAGGIDMMLGQLPGVPVGVQPFVPIVDALVLAPLSKEHDMKLGIADNINGMLRGVFGLADSVTPGGGAEVSEARTRAKAETGDLGEASRLLASLWHWVRETDTGR
jgi:hypothetical protein